MSRASQSHPSRRGREDFARLRASGRAHSHVQHLRREPAQAPGRTLGKRGRFRGRGGGKARCGALRRGCRVGRGTLGRTHGAHGKADLRGGVRLLCGNHEVRRNRGRRPHRYRDHDRSRGGARVNPRRKGEHPSPRILHHDVRGERAHIHRVRRGGVRARGGGSRRGRHRRQLLSRSRPASPQGG